MTCADTDECALGLHNCDDNASCINLYGSYECSCDNGFTGNGENCFDVDECEIENTCGNNGVCRTSRVLTAVVVTTVMPELVAPVKMLTNARLAIEGCVCQWKS